MNRASSFFFFWHCWPLFDFFGLTASSFALSSVLASCQLFSSIFGPLLATSAILGQLWQTDIFFFHLISAVPRPAPSFTAKFLHFFSQTPAKYHKIPENTRNCFINNVLLVCAGKVKTGRFLGLPSKKNTPRVLFFLA